MISFFKVRFLKLFITSTLPLFLLAGLIAGQGKAFAKDLLKSTLNNSSEGHYVILTWLSDIPFRPSLRDRQDFSDKEYDDEYFHVNAVHLSWNEDKSQIKVSEEHNNVTRTAFINRNFWLPFKSDAENYYWLVDVLYFTYGKNGQVKKVPQILYGHSYLKYRRHLGHAEPDCEAFADIHEINISRRHLSSVINPLDQLAKKIDMGLSCDLPKITKAFVLHNSPHPDDGHLIQSRDIPVSPELILSWNAAAESDHSAKSNPN